MNQAIRIILTLGLSIAAVLIILLLTEYFGPHTPMDVFVAETVRSAVGQDVVTEQYVEASLPRRFQRDMTKTWLHRSTPYSVTLPSILGQSISATDQTMTYTVENYASYPASLPYPPEDLWCVRLKSADPTIPKVVLLALHQDMYTARWAVHEPVDADAVLAAVGCRFPSQ
jgi:hypothetical protein